MMRWATVKSPLHKRPIPLITFSNSPLRRADRSSSEGVAATLLVEGGSEDVAAMRHGSGKFLVSLHFMTASATNGA
jgi:hypothetical protein